jgi:uncharacterized protein
MSIICLLSHPAQFLFYRNIINNLRKQGHVVHVLIKTKDVLESLVVAEGWSYQNIQPRPRKSSKTAILLSLIERDFKILNIALKVKPKLMVGSDASLAQVGKLLNIPCITTTEDDYEVIKNLAKLAFPFTSLILTPEVCDTGRWIYKKMGYKGYMKLAYLHPNQFTPDRSKVKIPIDKPYFLLRLSGLKAHHDLGIKGISKSLLDQIVKKLSTYGSVYISSESGDNDYYPDLRLSIPVSDMHHYLAFANLLISDSQSMSVEAAMLGVPNIRISDFAGRISVLEELEKKYQLTFGLKPLNETLILNRLDDLLVSIVNYPDLFRDRRIAMLSDKIDVTSFVTWLIGEYPQSIGLLKQDPSIQNKFR